MGSQALFISVLKDWPVNFANADGTNYKTIAAGGTSGSKIESLSGANTSTTVATIMQLVKTIGGVDYPIGQVTIPAKAGTDAAGTVKATDLLNNTDLPWVRSDGVNRFLELAPGSTLKAKALTAVAGADVVTLMGSGGDI